VSVKSGQPYAAEIDFQPAISIPQAISTTRDFLIETLQPGLPTGRLLPAQTPAIGKWET
jgi:hypothetical protein